MKYKLAVTDLDGTLLDKNSNISEQNLRAVEKLRAKGCIFTMITGRMYSAAKTYIDILDCKELVGLYQGAEITDIRNKSTIYKATLKQSVCEEIYKDALRLGLNIQAYADDKVYAESYDENTAFYERLCRVKINIKDSIEDIVSSENNIKLLINTDKGSVTRNLEFFIKKYSGDANVVRSGEHFIEFTHKNADKGKALEIIAKHYGIERSQIIAFGDQMNDIPMIKYAGMGVAMKNAPDDVKKYADLNAPANDESGVAYVLEKLCK